YSTMAEAVADLGFVLCGMPSKATSRISPTPVSDPREPTEREPTEREPTEREPTEREPTEREPTEREPIKREPIKREPTEREPIKREPIKREPIKREPIKREPIKREPIKREPTKREPIKREPQVEAAPAISFPEDIQPLADTLDRAGLFSPEELVDFLETMDRAHRPTTARGLAQTLVSAELLTGYQTAWLLRGEERQLFFGDHLVHDKIAGCEHSELFLAEHRESHSWRALKTFTNSKIQSPEDERRLQADLEAASRVEHPSLARIHGGGIHQGMPYAAYDFIEGTDLERLVKRDGPLPFAKAMEFLIQAADGLSAAHRGKLFHWNLKPSQLLLGEDGRIRIADWGVARFSPAVPRIERALTQSMIWRTELFPAVDFAAPERSLDPRSADARADVYSLG
ncbi:MAG: protein kinase, partial [Planctomycetales bacterium]